MSDERKRPAKVARIKPRPEVVRDLVRKLAADTLNVKWSVHALERMEERAITDKMALEVLRQGSLKGDVEEGANPGELKVKMVRQMRGHREVGVVVVTIKGLHLLVKTAEWEDVR